MRVVFIVIHYQRERFNDWKLRIVTVQMVLETLDRSTSANFEFQTMQVTPPEPSSSKA